MSGVAESANEDQLLAFDPDEDNNAGISGEKHLDIAKGHGGKGPERLEHFDVARWRKAPFVSDIDLVTENR